MTVAIGQIVQSVKDKMSHDWRMLPMHSRTMAIWSNEQSFNEAFIARVHHLRESMNWTAAEMASALDIPAERYRKYESRSLLPHYLIEPFALIVGRDVEYVLTGKSSRPARKMVPQLIKSDAPKSQHKSTR